MRIPIAALILYLLLPMVVGAWEDEPVDGTNSSSLEVRIVDAGLDPGHSQHDVGTEGGGLAEYQLTLKVATRVKQMLEEAGLAVALSRQDKEPLTDFSDPDPTEAVRLEQEARIEAVGNATLYVSIHFNGHPNRTYRGMEVYYNADNYGEESLALAKAIHGRLLASVEDAGYDLPDRGVKEDLTVGKPYAHFFSLRGPMPSVLVEPMFLTNPTEAALLRDEAVIEAIARGISDGIIEYLRPDPDDVVTSKVMGDER